MDRRFIFYGFSAALFAVGLLVAADALVESDEERLEPLAGALLEEGVDARIDAVLRWTDPETTPVAIGRSTFGEGRQAALESALRERLSPLLEADGELVQQSVRVREDRASVALRLRDSTAELHDVSFALRRHGQGWLIERIRVL